MGLFSNKIGRDDLRSGDHVYSWRGVYTYSHHGIYVGSNKVVHFTRASGQELGTGTIIDSSFSSQVHHQTCLRCADCGFQRENSGVTLSCLDCFLKGGLLYRFEYGVAPAVFFAQARGGTCTLAESDPPDTVINRAMYLLQNGFGNYHIFHNNCEDFAIYCKTGLLVTEENAPGRSGQAASVISAPLAALSYYPLRALMANPVSLATVTAGVYSFNRYATDIGVRTDVVKIPVEDLAANLGWSTNMGPSPAESSRIPK
ncbi:hypothetical protein SUGI_1203030 [Cryptomeria japonica]|uniref:protein LEAD-SENSITIVE 1 n=1 Tax=Cryptomeria japonica TaxID=3369 RepID=UPI00241468F4|nr:protein LEAD-SENSITIVE 1 [Cryptomeria japonica]GLJ56030.1 hypothetical protein SUGI_1203030 [Cryptomeria japonica]